MGLRHKAAHAMVLRDLQVWVRVEFLGTGARLGLFVALRDGCGEDELAERLGVVNRSLFRALLEIGSALGELRERNGRWSLRGARARALGDARADELAALLDEEAGYSADVYLALGARLRGAPPGDYLAEWGEVVARSSRVAEPALSAVVRAVARRVAPARVLDVGCGSGVYLGHVAAAVPKATGVGIDRDAGAVGLAARHLAGLGLADRIRVQCADLQSLPAGLAGPWDLVLLLQNIYYFPVEDRPALLTQLRELVGDGTLVVGTAVAGTGDPFAAHLDLVLQSTVGNHALPTVADLERALRSAGFTRVTRHAIAPRQPLRVFEASARS